MGSEINSEESDAYSDVDSEPNVPETPESQPLYEGSKVDVNTVIGSILDFYISHSLPKLALSDLLSLIDNLIPQPKLLPQTKYKLDQFIIQNAPSAEHMKHFYCSTCHQYIGVLETEAVFVDQKMKRVFFMYNLKSLLKNFLENGKIHKFLKANSSSDIISDIHDGRCLREANQRLKLGSYDLNLLWNTDGAPVFKSSKSQLWPLQFTICEIPPDMRHKYVIVAGMWYGPEKPDIITFLKPFTENLVELSMDGFEWCIPDTKKVLRSRVFAPVVCLDAPARASVTNVHQYNGEFGCNICEKKGVVIGCGEGTSRIYNADEVSSLRTKEEMSRNAIEAVASGKVVKGVKGPSILNTLVYFNLAQAFVPDYMHCILLGVVRQFLILWLNPSNRNCPWSL